MSDERIRRSSQGRARSTWELKRERTTPEDAAFTLKVPTGDRRRAARLLKLPKEFRERLKAFETPVTEETLSRLVSSTRPDEASGG